jgi:hypothetical protein
MSCKNKILVIIICVIIAAVIGVFIYLGVQRCIAPTYAILEKSSEIP